MIWFKNEYELIGFFDGWLGEEVWKSWIMNVVGNYDIGYVGDLIEECFEWFECVFGKVNYEFWFELLIIDFEVNVIIRDNDFELYRLFFEIWILVINDMNFDILVKFGLL